MAGNTFSELLLIEGCLVGAGLKELGLARVTLAANVRHGSYAGRRRTVIAMAVIAGWR
jgi:hypothetical protein